MIKIKSISKRALAILLAVLMMLTSGIIGAVAANVDIAETGAQYNLNWQGKVYFLAPETWDIDTYKYIQVDITRTTSATASNYQYYAGTMTRIGSSRLFYLQLSADHSSWSQNEYIAFTANSSTYGSGTFALNGNHYYTTPLDYGCNNSSNYYLFKPSTATSNSTTSNGNAMTGSYGTNRNTVLRATQTVSITCDDVASSACGTVKMTGYYDSTDNTITSSTATSTSSSITYNAVQGSQMTLTATAKTGYNFVGWYSGSTLLSSNATYTYSVYNAKTVTAKFESLGYTVTFDDGTNTTTQTVAEGEYPTKPADPTPETGYEFLGWSTDGTAENIIDVTTTPITGETTYHAVYGLSNYTVTVNTNGNGGTASADVDSVTYGGTVTLTAVADTANGYKFANWTIDGEYAEEGTVDLTATSITITPSSDITATANFALEEYEVAVNVVPEEGGTATATPSVAEHGSDVILKAEANSVEGYVFDGWEIVGSYVTADDLASETITITVTTDITATANFKQMPMYDVTASANNADAGTVTPESGRVIEGSAITLSAISNPGYVFESWTITSDSEVKVVSGSTTDAAITFIPYAEVTAVANFKAVTGTVNVTAAEGGSVDNAGGSVTYPASVTSTATANEADGYIFSGWTVTSEGKEGTDYTVTENDNTITVTVLTEGTVVNVVADFANAQKIKVYTYSENGFTSLHVTESNGTAQDVYDGSQTLVQFGNENWYTPGELTLTAGYYEAITAQMYGSNPLSGGTGNLVIFNNTLGWDQVYLYTSSTTMWNTNTADATTKGRTAVQMQQIGSTNYYFAFVEGSFTYTLFLETENNNYDRVWQNNAAYRSDYKSTAPMFTPNTTASATASDANNQTNYYNNGSWAAAPTIPTQTNTIDITAALYNGDEWLGKEEIWLYFDSTLSAYVATDRRQLNDYVESALIKSTYNKGSNDRGYTDSSWSDFANAYEDAVSVLGAGASTQTEIDNAYTTLEAAYKALELTKTVTITGSHGAMPGFGTYYGTISFPDLTVTKNTGNIGDADSAGSSPNCEYLTATVNRDQIITINTKVNDANHVVFGWVINGTDFVSATQDIDDTTLYVGTYTCDSNAVIVPIYFRADTLKKIQSRSEEDSSKVIKVYAKADDSSTTWGNYMAAYTWTASTYKQFGRWTGQLMIPDVSSPGMYYTYVETSNPDDSTEVITGITFNNYGNNTGINADQRYQAYDYYEFIDLAAQGYDNIVFELNESDGVSNWPTKSGIDLDNNVYNFYPFVDFSGNQIDITRTALTDEQKALDTALYIVRTGPCDDLDGIGYQEDKIAGSDYYINTYVYDADGTFLVACKSFELLDLATLATNSGVDLSVYAGQPVVVDYASLTDTSGNLRYDGEWYGTKLGETKVNISVQVAYLNEDGTVTYYYDAETPNYVETVGSAYINGEASAELNHGSEGHTISASALAGNDFVGWYLATKNEDGSISIDASATPLFTEFANTIDASSDAIYVAVFEEHPVGTFTVNNYYYTYADFAGQTISPYAPPVFGGDTSYSIRDVQIKKVYDSYTDSTVTDKDLGRAGTYTQSIDAVSPGDQLEITIYTKPTYSRDYMYAWYIQSNDSYGVNFEEVGTDRAFTSADAGVEQSFTFTYTVKEGDTSITIYSDVVHITPEITLTYIYNNRYNVEQKYIVKYTLTNGELASYTPSDDTIRTNAPYVDDLYKNVEWVIENVSADATNWTLRATESDEYTINLNVDGVVATETGKFNQTVSLYASDINPAVEKAQQGLWYIENGTDGDFTAGEDEILGYGSYYGLVITEDATIYYVSDATLTNQIILADAVYGYERATDENGNVTTNKVYVDYLITNLLNVFTGGYVDVNGNGIQDANEPTVKDDVNTFTPVSLAAIEAAGYKVDYGMVLELINTFTESTRQDMIDTYYNGTHVMNTDQIKAMLDADASVWAETGYKGDTYFYSYSAKDLGATATNKNRVLMTFGYNNTDSNRNRYYNAIAYLKITNSDNTETLYLFSNQAKLNIAEADKVTNS